MRKNDDGTVDVWYRGWKLAYPGGGGKPEITNEEPPDGAGAADDAKWAESELKRDGWLVKFDSSPPRAIRVKRRGSPLDVILRLTYAVRRR
jgi:hypothetical protein